MSITDCHNFTLRVCGDAHLNGKGIFVTALVTMKLLKINCIILQSKDIFNLKYLFEYLPQLIP